MIGQRVWNVIRMDQTTTNVKRGRFTCLIVEVDLSKPLLYKFKVNRKFGRFSMKTL